MKVSQGPWSTVTFLYCLPRYEDFSTSKIDFVQNNQGCGDGDENEDDLNDENDNDDASGF